MATESEIVGIMRLLNQAYPDTKYAVNDTLIEIWVSILGQFDLAILKAATVKLISESSYIPKVADIVKQMRSLVALSRPTAADAWGVVHENIRDIGPYRMTEALAALPPAIRSVVQKIGYQEICDSEPGIIRAQFMRMYDQQAARQVEVALLPAGVGEVVRLLADRSNACLAAGEPLRLDAPRGGTASMKQIFAGIGKESRA